MVERVGNLSQALVQQIVDAELSAAAIEIADRLSHLAGFDVTINISANTNVTEAETASTSRQED